MQTARGQPYNPIPNPDGGAVYDLRVVNKANCETGHVVFIFFVKIGHFCRFPSYQGTARLFASGSDPLNKLFDKIEVYAAHGKVVQEKKRPRALNDNVVDTHGHQVYSDR